MSKKTNSQRKEGRISLPLVAILAGGVVLIFAALILSTGRPDGGGDTNGTASLTVDQEKIDFGDVKLDTPLTFSIKVTNTGDGTLRFIEKPYIEVVEGC